LYTVSPTTAPSCLFFFLTTPRPPIATLFPYTTLFRSPQFNTVLFNGRQMPSANDSRGFNFDTVAAEMVSGVEVYKTSTATTQSGDRKSTRLNSSHVKISYAVFCLKKKKKEVVNRPVHT